MIDKEILNVITPLIARFPFLPISNARYDRNFISVIKETLEVIKENSHFAKDNLFEETIYSEVAFLDGNSYEYDQEKIKDLTNLIEKDISDLKSHVICFDHIVTDLKKLKEKGEIFSKISKKLIRLSPLIYDSEGNVLGNMRPQDLKFSNFEVNQIQSLYQDHFPEHLAPLLAHLSNQKGFGEIHKTTRNTLNHFIPKKIIPATLYYSKQKKTAKEKYLRLEEVPKVFTPLRGNIGGDCSMLSVPFYGLHSAAKVLWIFKNKDKTKPEGYIFLFEQKVQQKIIPTIVTINGINLTTIDCQVAYKQIGKIYKTNYIHIINWRKKRELVNSKNPIESIKACKETKTQIETPPNWDSTPKGNHFSDYYHSSMLNSALVYETDLVDIQMIKPIKIGKQSSYHQKSISELTLISKAIIAHYFYKISDRSKVNAQDILTLLDINQFHLDNIFYFIDVIKNNNLTVEAFIRLNQSFNFNLNDLQKLPIHKSAKVLRPIYNEMKDKFSQKEWKDLFIVSFNDIKKMLANNPTPGYSDELKEMLVSIPDEFLTNYWEDIKPLFFLNESTDPDMYLIGRYLKHFHSYGTIEQFIEFINSNAFALNNIEAKEKRWFDFFKRAKDMMANNHQLKNILKIVYYDASLSTDQYINWQSLVKLYFFGTQLIDQLDHLQWKNQIFDKHNYDNKKKDEFHEYLKKMQLQATA